MLNTIIKRSVRRLGFELHRYRAANSTGPQFIAMLSSHNVNLVFDVGANTGQFARKLREDGYYGRIVSFEPLSVAHEELLLSSKRDPLWEVAPRAAIGDDETDVELNIARNSASSSVLNMLPAHTAVVPSSRYIGTERVSLRRLDTVAKNYLQANSVPFIKIDTQGYEDRVLTGASQLLDRLVGIQLELSLVPLYEDQSLFSEMMELLESKGFNLWAIWQSFVDETTGRLLQADATFFRR